MQSAKRSARDAERLDVSHAHDCHWPGARRLRGQVRRIRLREKSYKNAIAGLGDASRRPERVELPGMRVQQPQKPCARAARALARGCIRQSVI